MKNLSFSDGLAIIGLLLLGAGLWLLMPPIALIVVGSILLTIGLFAAVTRQ